MKIELPPQPVDGYEITWHSVSDRFDPFKECFVWEAHLVYSTTTRSWTRSGDGYSEPYTYPAIGWQDLPSDILKEWYELRGSIFTTRHEALTEAKRRVTDHVARLEADLRSAKVRLYELSQELNP